MTLTLFSLVFVKVCDVVLVCLQCLTLPCVVWFVCMLLCYCFSWCYFVCFVIVRFCSFRVLFVFDSCSAVDLVVWCCLLVCLVCHLLVSAWYWFCFVIVFRFCCSVCACLSLLCVCLFCYC